MICTSLQHQLHSKSLVTFPNNLSLWYNYSPYPHLHRDLSSILSPTPWIKIYGHWWLKKVMKIDSVLKWGWKLTKYTSSQWDSRSIYHHHSNIHYNYTYMKQINLTIIYYDQPSLIFHVESVIMLNISNQICHQKLKREYIMSTKKKG